MILNKMFKHCWLLITTRLSQERASAFDRLLTTLAQQSNYYEGEQTMSDKEKFTYFKQQKKLAANEETYGEEIRGRLWGRSR